MELEKYEADCHWKISWSRLHSFFGKFIRFPFISRVLLSLSPLLQTINWNYQLKLSTETPRCTEESRSADNERLITQEHIHSLPITRSNMLIVLLITDPGQQKPVVVVVVENTTQEKSCINQFNQAFYFPTKLSWVLLDVKSPILWFLIPWSSDSVEKGAKGAAKKVATHPLVDKESLVKERTNWRF